MDGIQVVGFYGRYKGVCMRCGWLSPACGYPERAEELSIEHYQTHKHKEIGPMDINEIPVKYAGLIAGYLKVSDNRNVKIVTSENGPAGVLDLLGTETPSGEAPARNFKERLGRCNELTAYALLFGNAPDDALLIHGSMQGPFEGTIRIRHAWLLVKGEIDMVWEPAHGLWYPKQDWYKYASARVERAYTRQTALRHVVEHETYGPWHDSQYPQADDMEKHYSTWTHLECVRPDCNGKGHVTIASDWSHITEDDKDGDD